MPPESSRLQGQTSTVVVLIVFARFGTAGVHVTVAIQELCQVL
ncbi:hypothetical protein DW66_3201 [Pseudomonas putida]|nr:conserved hypothetical protein [Pseudomonas putida S16]AHZ77709.1 hypothetical protein DW66_3201 [Pseudomonas putida]